MCTDAIDIRQYTFAVDFVFSLQGIEACMIVLGSVLVLIVATFLPKQRRARPSIGSGACFRDSE